MPATQAQLAKLREPLPPYAIEWRAQQSGEKNGKPWVKALAYLTNRAVQDRLDDVVGEDNWKNEYRPGPSGGVVCGISIFVERPGRDDAGEWMTRWDGAENTDVEGVKGGLSDSMKRAAVQWGIGRYLYNLEEGWGRVAEGNARGVYTGKTKDGKFFTWDAPTLPAWALPGGSGHPDIPAPVRRPHVATSPVGMPPKPSAEKAAAVLAEPSPYGDEPTDTRPLTPLGRALVFPYPFHEGKPEHGAGLGTLPSLMLQSGRSGVRKLRATKGPPDAHAAFYEAAGLVLDSRGESIAEADEDRALATAKAERAAARAAKATPVPDPTTATRKETADAVGAKQQQKRAMAGASAGANDDLF